MCLCGFIICIYCVQTVSFLNSLCECHKKMNEIFEENIAWSFKYSYILLFEN